MLKLKLINKPKMMKLKCNFTFPNIVLANLQEKKATPSEEVQEIVADVPYDGLSKVILDKIPSEYIVPEGEINIIKNGVYDVTEMASANVDVPEKKLGTKKITQNGVYNASDDSLDGYSSVKVETSGVNIYDYWMETAPQTNVQNIMITLITKIPYIDISNVTQMINAFASFARLKEIPLLDFSNVTNMQSAFSDCQNLETIPQLNTSKVTNMQATFNLCKSLKSIPNLDYSNVTICNNLFSNCSAIESDIDIELPNANNINSLFNGCSKIKKVINVSALKSTQASYLFYLCGSLEQVLNLNIPLVTNIASMFDGCINLKDVPDIECSNVNNITYAFDNCRSLTNLGRLNNIGKNYSTTSSANNSSYRISLSYCVNLTHESLMNVINSLYDIKTAGVKPQQLLLGSTNLAKLTEDEIAIATNKGWNVS